MDTSGHGRKDLTWVPEERWKRGNSG